MPLHVVLRPATSDDLPAVRSLIADSARALSVGYYAPAVAESAIRYVFGVDTQLVIDGTYSVALDGDGRLLGCGGWSRWAKLYGGDQADADPPARLDPARDAARIRAVFTHPAAARLGVASAIVRRAEREARAAGFGRATLVSTLPGEPFYLAREYRVMERQQPVLPDGARLDVVVMERALADD